jgi:hypothetical protein
MEVGQHAEGLLVDDERTFSAEAWNTAFDPFRTCGELLLDHLVGAAEQGHREGNTERASGLEIDE